MDCKEVLDRIEERARYADIAAFRACLNSKYAITDYWLCIVVMCQALYDDIGKKATPRVRCCNFWFSTKVGDFKADLRKCEPPDGYLASPK